MKIENFKFELVAILIFGILAAIPIGAEENPAAEGVDAAGSDAKAIEIAEGVMAAMGGR